MKKNSDKIVQGDFLHKCTNRNTSDWIMVTHRLDIQLAIEIKLLTMIANPLNIEKSDIFPLNRGAKLQMPYYEVRFHF